MLLPVMHSSHCTVTVVQARSDCSARQPVKQASNDEERTGEHTYMSYQQGGYNYGQVDLPALHAAISEGNVAEGVRERL